MADFMKFQATVEKLVNGVYDLDGDTIKIALTNVAPNAATASQLSHITQIATAGGYTAGGLTVANTEVIRVGGTANLVGDNVEFTATGEMGPLRFAVLYDDTAADKPLLGYWDRGASVTLYENDKFTVVFGAQILSLS